jgi:hypothetical protein
LNSDTITPAVLLLTAVITVPVVFTSPVVIDESPPVFLLAVLLPESEFWDRLLLTVALLFWVFVTVVESEELAELLESVPFPELATVTLPTPKSDPATPEELLLVATDTPAALVISPVVMAAPVPPD